MVGIPLVWNSNRLVGSIERVYLLVIFVFLNLILFLFFLILLPIKSYRRVEGWTKNNRVEKVFNNKYIF